jgi:hypothetical protein
MALGLTQPLTEMSTTKYFWRDRDRERQARKADNLTAICGPTVWKMYDNQHPIILQASTQCYGDIFTFDVIYLKDSNFGGLPLYVQISDSQSKVSWSLLCKTRKLRHNGTAKLLPTARVRQFLWTPVYTHCRGLRKGSSNWRRTSAEQKLINKFKHIFY